MKKSHAAGEPFERTPHGWVVASLRDLAQITTGPFGTLLRAEEYSSGHGVPLISVGEIGDGHFRVTRHTPLVPYVVVRRLPQYVLRKGDIVFGRKGAVERSAHVGAVEEGWFLGSDGIRVRPKGECYSLFLAFQLRRQDIQDWLLRNAAGTIMRSLNQGILGRVSVALPPLAEQRAIASALSDVDALLDGLDRVIAKKRAIKQASMQQLLTGRTRLPGFSGEWEVKRLGDVAVIKTGSRNNDDKTPHGDYPFFVRSEVIERINSYSYECEAILVPGEGRIGDIFHYINGRFDVHQRVYAITQFEANTSGKFVHLYMAMHFGGWAMQNTVKATVDSLRLPTFQTFSLRIPPSIAEQTAIANVLSDMDAELETLEVRRQKTQQLKQGMMQELLTGRTRLV